MKPKLITRTDSLGRRYKCKPPKSREEWLDSLEHDRLSCKGRPFDYSPIKTKYVRARDYITYVCPEHGPQTVLAVGHVRHKCCHCSNVLTGERRRGTCNWRRFSLEAALARAKELHPDLDFSRVKSYDPKGVWKLKCPAHGWYEHKVRSLLWDKSRGCPECRAQRRVRVSEEHSERMRWQFDACARELGYEVLNYTRIRESVTLSCPTHGKFTLPFAIQLTQGSICPDCRRGSSKPEIVLGSRLRDIGRLGKIHFHRRDILRGLELDLYLPRYKLAIEVNGLRWHNAKVKDKGYHLNKTEEAEDRGLFLLHFTDIEVLTKTSLVVSMIHAKCGIFKHRMFARDTELVELSYSDTCSFLEANHIQGAIAGSLYLGLYADLVGKRRLVSVAVFGTPRFNKDYDYELLRFATLRACQVVGGLGKLVSAFRRSNFGSLLSYADRSYSQGGVYEALGFVHLRDTNPSYSWVHKDGRIYSRYQTQKHKLDSLLEDFEPQLSETENMELHGFWKIYNSGSKVYALEAQQ